MDINEEITKYVDERKKESLDKEQKLPIETALLRDAQERVKKAGESLARYQRSLEQAVENRRGYIIAEINSDAESLKPDDHEAQALELAFNAVANLISGQRVDHAIVHALLETAGAELSADTAAAIRVESRWRRQVDAAQRFYNHQKQLAEQHQKNVDGLNADLKRLKAEIESGPSQIREQHRIQGIVDEIRTRTPQLLDIYRGKHPKSDTKSDSHPAEDQPAPPISPGITLPIDE